ncbi:unnamed protein product [Peniophora sp. CBMAI 1063]|nr:unnamed protein product [Peniophora sp. CBMAI 1063]
MARNQDSKEEQPSHTTASPGETLHPSVRRRPVPRPPKCGRDALAGYATGAAVGSALALAYFFTSHTMVKATPSQFLWRSLAYGGVPGVAAAELYHAISATAWWAEVVEPRWGS